MNVFVGVGRLTKDPELRETRSGAEVCNFTLALQRPFKNSDGDYITDFPMCTAWKHNARFISKYFKKGDPISIVGSIQTRNYDGDDGKRVYITEINVDRAEFVGSKSNNSSRNSNNYFDEPEYPSGGDNDLPFDF